MNSKIETRFMRDARGSAGDYLTISRAGKNASPFYDVIKDVVARLTVKPTYGLNC